tara:strand:+ start:83 stop:559 length:477 start_codon:yes stop_codon:yes gene_type:complete
VTVIGGTKKQRQLTENVVWYCISELMPRHSTLEIEVQLTKCLDEGAYGFCALGNTDRDFTIEVDKRIPKFKNGNPNLSGLNRFIETICHEMVHVYQTATGLMIDRVYPVKLGYRKLWKTKDGSYVDYTHASWSKQPWERQAIRMEGKLAKGFMKSWTK